MNANLPKYMSIKDFCSYSGYSRYQFMRLADRAHIELKSYGTFRLLNVQEPIVVPSDTVEKLKKIVKNPEPADNEFLDAFIDEHGGRDSFLDKEFGYVLDAVTPDEVSWFVFLWTVIYVFKIRIKKFFRKFF